MLCDNADAVRHDGNSVSDDDSVPVVIQSRYRLADCVARAYGMQAYLVDCGDPIPGEAVSYRWMVCVQSECKHWSVPWLIANPRRFHDGLVACHALLEQVFSLGKTLGELLVSGTTPLEGPISPPASRS